MIFILFVPIPQSTDNQEKCLTFAFYENRIKHANILKQGLIIIWLCRILNISIQEVIQIGNDTWCMFATAETADLASL